MTNGIIVFGKFISVWEKSINRSEFELFLYFHTVNKMELVRIG